MSIHNIAVIGLGKVGSLVGTLLQEHGFNVTGIDVHPTHNLPFPCQAVDIAAPNSLSPVLKDTHAVVSCLPYHMNLLVASAAHALGIHYFDLTEDITTTHAIREMALSSQAVMAPQCGLAPGFIAIIGAELARRFSYLRSIELRVGALPQNPSGMLGYAFNWSPEGVVNEYLNDCEVIRSGELKNVPAMQEQETIVINGIKLEAYTTSGGLGTMCETFLGKVRELNYKTLRYPGHFSLMRFLLHELGMKEDKETVGRILVNAKPPVNDDIVYVYAAAVGKGHYSLGDPNAWYREEFVRAYLPRTIAGKSWRAISWTTAASIAAIVEMVAHGTLPAQGFLKQETVPLEAFLATRAGKLYT